MEDGMYTKKSDNHYRVIIFSFLGFMVGVIVFMIIDPIVSAKAKKITVAGENGEAMIVYYKSFEKFDDYVEGINEVVYDNNKTILDCNFPDTVYYQDKNGTQFLKKITCEDDYIEMLNLFYYNDEFKVNKMFLPKYVVFYTMN